MDEPTVTVTREQLRRAAVAAWTDCIPRAHMNFDRFWQLLVDGTEIPDSTTTDDVVGYSVMSYEAWVDREEGDFGPDFEPWAVDNFEPPQP